MRMRVPYSEHESALQSQLQKLLSLRFVRTSLQEMRTYHYDVARINHLISSENGRKLRWVTQSDKGHLCTTQRTVRYSAALRREVVPIFLRQ